MTDRILPRPIHLSIRPSPALIWLEDRIPTEMCRSSCWNNMSLGTTFEENRLVAGSVRVGERAESCGGGGGEAGEEGIQSW